MAGARFAPSPTGSFHIGNLRTAWISWKLAQSHRLPWVVRFEDIDQPRVIPGAQEEQLGDMRELGLFPDAIVVQSARRARHWELFQRALALGQVYPCVCSRKEIQSALEGLASAPHLPLGEAPSLYSGKCRTLSSVSPAVGAPLGWRFKDADSSGTHDFIIARTAANKDPASFVPSYHWACAIDDLDGEYEILVRAADLGSATDLQRKVQAWICGVENRAPRFPAVFHTSLIVQNDGHRLEKRTAGVTLRELKAQGWRIEAILERFEASVDLSLLQREFEPSEIFGESAVSRTLRELGFNSELRE